MRIACGAGSMLVAFASFFMDAGSAAAEPVKEKPRYADRWVYASYNLQVEAHADELAKLIDRSAKAGYNGLVLADYKLNILDRVPQHYFRNLERVRKAADAAKIELIPSVFPIGYSSGLLAHDPNLAEGIPARDVPFVVKNGLATLEKSVSLKNGGFEEAKGDKLSGMGFQDGAGHYTFVDREVFAEGKQSLRIEDASGNARVSQRIACRPWSCFRLSAKIKTKGFQGKGELKLLAIGADGRSLSFHEVHPAADQDWTPIEVVFNSLSNKEVNLYLGVWTGTQGKLWLDDWKLEEPSLTNVLRRDACPFSVKSQDGKTTYEEGKDFLPVKDEKLGAYPYAGEYGFGHEGPPLKIVAGPRIKEGEKLLVTWYHPVAVHGLQVACSLSDPKVFTLLEDQAARVQKALRPKTWFMSHDEIRVTGWCDEALKSGKTPGRRLAENVRRCAEILRKLDPDARIVVWSDMFDPNHNAVDQYYLVNGSLAGSWEGLDPKVVMANWNSGKAAASLKFFADRGHPQILSGVYDTPGLEGFSSWNAAAKGVRGADGFMYTTWRQDYRQLEAYGKAIAGE